MKGLFVSAYKLILDGYKPKAHPNGSINSRFYRSPLTSESPKQLKARFPRRVPNLAYLVSERIFLGCPSPRQSSPPTPLACAPSPPRSSPCGASARAPALWNRAAPPPWLWICAAPKQSGDPCPPRGGAAPLALSSTRPSKQASSIQKQSSEHRRFHVPPDLRMLVCRCRV